MSRHPNGWSRCSTAARKSGPEPSVRNRRSGLAADLPALIGLFAIPLLASFGIVAAAIFLLQGIGW